MVLIPRKTRRSFNDNAYFQVIPSGINTIFGGEYVSGGVYDTSVNLGGRDQGPSGYPNASARTSNSVSGVLGILTDSAAGTAILSLGTYDTTKAIILTQNAANAATYAVTYGQVMLANNVADSRVSMGEQTWTSGT